MPYFERRWKIKGTVLSPVHIGCDEVLDPFCIAYEGGKIIEFDLSKTVAESDERARNRLAERLAAPVTTAAHADAIRKLIIEEMPWRKHKQREFAVSASVEDSFGKRGERFLEKTRQADIQLTSHNPLTGQRIVPGSSLKGAMRTALLDARAVPSFAVQMTGRQRDDDREYDRFQKEVLSFRQMQEDPFGEWKVSDCPVLANCESVIDRPDLHRRGLNKEPMLFTSLVEALESQEDGPHFEGTLAVVRRLKGVAKPVMPEEVMHSVNEHTRRTFEEAYHRVLHPQSFPPEARDNIETVWEWIESVKDSATSCVLRLGRFSGFLNMTVDHQRYLKAFVQRGEIKREALTGQKANPTLRPLTMDGLPFGFVKLELEDL